jgi:hypothetical protein
LSQLRLTPYYLVDKNLSPVISKAFHDCGYDITCVQAQFQNQSKVDDYDIIQYLGQYGRQNSVWFTADADAARVHGKILKSKQNSVLWIYRPRSGLSRFQELLLSCLVIEDVHKIISNTANPIYLRATLLPNRKSKLENLVSPIGDPHMFFRKISTPI